MFLFLENIRNLDSYSFQIKGEYNFKRKYKLLKDNQDLIKNTQKTHRTVFLYYLLYFTYDEYKTSLVSKMYKLRHKTFLPTKLATKDFLDNMQNQESDKTGHIANCYNTLGKQFGK